MKKFPIKLQEDYTQVTPETFNDNLQHYVQEYNGGLDSQNMPVSGLSFRKFKAVQTTDLSTANYYKWKAAFETQAYYETRKTVNPESAIWYEPIVELDLKTYSWGKGWNPLPAAGNLEDIVIQDQMKEGMLNGCARINFKHGYNVVSYQSGETVLHAEVGFDWWTKWGVFVNGVLVAESDEIYPRGENVVIPFSVPVGSQQVTIEIKWKTITTNALSTPSYTDDPTTDLEIWGIGIWARNTYR